jgi:hypothetical protein
MKASIDFAQVRVYLTTDEKGNDVVVGEILGEQVLFTDPWIMAESWLGLSGDDARMRSLVDEALEKWLEYGHEMLSAQVARILARMVIADGPSMWRLESPTGRSTRRGPDRVEEPES